MRCGICGGEFEAKNSRAKFCSSRCQAAAWQGQRKDDLALVEEQLTRALIRVRALRGSKTAAKGGGSCQGSACSLWKTKP